MAKHKVADLLNQFMEDHGQSSGKDRVMLWFEDLYSKLRSLPWSWNFNVTETQTGGDYWTDPVRTSTEKFTWTKGSDNITATSTLTLGDDLTGRFIYIENEWYRCIRINPDGLNKIYLDKKIVSASVLVADAKVLSFYRRNLSFMTNGIKSLHVDDKKLEHITEEQIYRFKRGIDPRWYYGDSGQPLGYHADEFQIKAPLKAPHVVETVGATAGPTEGIHVAFFTFYDVETGQESPPGPSVEFKTTSTTSFVKLHYGEESGKHSDETTYSRRTYVTKKKDTYTRMPAYELGELEYNATTGETFSVSDSALGALAPYYDGPWTNAMLYPAPDEYKRAEALHINSYPGLPSEEDIITLGRQREFIDLFHVYFLMKQSLQNKDPALFRQMQGSFREQLNFLQGKDGEDRKLDPSSWEYRFFSPTTAVLRDEEFTASLKYPF